MANDVGEDELDGILDDALDAFDVVRRPATVPTGCMQGGDATSLSKTPDEPSPADEAPPEVSVEAAKAFEDALKALGDLGIDQGDADEEEDMKLVEEFMKSLGGNILDFNMPGMDGNAAATGSANRGEGQGSAPAIGPGTGPSPGMEKLVESIMGQLLSEDVLKAPMLQMRTAYQEWLPKKAEELSAEELGRYTKQLEIVEEICEKYESGAATTVIVELLTKMQECGAPPAEVINSLPGDADNADGDFAGTAQPDMEKLMESCRMQ